MRDKLLAEWFWTDRWTGSSAFLLPMEARGVYREMLTQAWRRGAKLPNDHEAIRRAIGCTLREWRRAWPQVEKFWTMDGGNLVNATQVEVYTAAAIASEKFGDRASRAARARWDAPSNAPSIPQALPEVVPEHVLEQCPPSLSPSPEDQNNRETRAREADDDIGDRARRFLERYAELFHQHRKGARYYAKPALDFPEAVRLCGVWDDGRLETLAEAFLTTDDKFCRQGTGSVAHFSSRASWCDVRLRQHGL